MKGGDTVGPRFWLAFFFNLRWSPLLLLLGKLGLHLLAATSKDCLSERRPLQHETGASMPVLLARPQQLLVTCVSDDAVEHLHLFCWKEGDGVLFWALTWCTPQFQNQNGTSGRDGMSHWGIHWCGKNTSRMDFETFAIHNKSQSTLCVSVCQHCLNCKEDPTIACEVAPKQKESFQQFWDKHASTNLFSHQHPHNAF